MARILVVDDDCLWRECLCEILAENGHEVSWADNGCTCLDFLERTLPDLVLMDLFMPVMDGIAAIMDIRNRYPELNVIAMSGGAYLFDSRNYLKMANVLGAVCILDKPFDGASLLRAVGQAQKSGA